jgi:hypothetical protein
MAPYKFSIRRSKYEKIDGLLSNPASKSEVVVFIFEKK